MNSPIKNKAVIYCRVSSKEQEETGYSLPAQEKFLREYANKPENNFNVVRVFEVSESAGGKVRRKIFHEMMDYIRKNKIPVVIVETTDRLTRNFADVPMIDAWILEDENRQIHLAKESCILHRDSKSHEWFMWRVKVATAEYYVKLLSENVKKGQKEKLAQGSLPTKPPLGYKTIGDKGHKIHIIDGKDEKGNLIGHAAHIKWMFEQYATGNYSIARLEKELYEKANVDEKRLLLSQIFTNLVQDELKIKPEYTKAADFLLEWMPKLNQSYELAKSEAIKGKTPAFADVHPIWLRTWDDVREALISQ